MHTGVGVAGNIIKFAHACSAVPARSALLCGAGFKVILTVLNLGGI
jgi:hypothetical protein